MVTLLTHYAGYDGQVTEGAGLRERKKDRTRKRLHDTAVRLFLERGFDQVTVAQVADAADTAVTTLFAYFPAGKVALVFDRDEDRAAALTAAIRGRSAGQDPLHAIEAFMAHRLPFDQQDASVAGLLELIISTPALRDHAHRRWTYCEDALVAVLAEQMSRSDDASLRALARLLLECPDIASRQPRPRAALTTVMGHLRRGWDLG